nr:Proteinase inhibitor I2 domain containing protein [Haemonchus contortus]
MRGITLHRVLMVTTLLTFSCYVNGSQCYRGDDEYYTIDTTESSQRCSFAAEPACNFTQEKYGMHKIESLSGDGKCWYQAHGRGIICFCNADLCNGNFTILVELWKQKAMDNSEIHQCTLEYLKSKETLIEERAVPLAEYEANITTTLEASVLETIASPLVDTEPMTGPSSMTTIPVPRTTIEYELSTEEVQMTTLDYGNESGIELSSSDTSQTLQSSMHPDHETSADHETSEGDFEISSGDETTEVGVLPDHRHPDANPCVLPPDAGTPYEGVAQEMWFFKESEASCAQFEYLGAGGNANRFVDEVTCMRVCGTEFVSAVHGETHYRAGEASHALCDLPLEPGNGTFSIPRFYFNKGEEKCEPFDYTGDGGNGNRFLTEEDCEQLCFANRYGQELASPQGDDTSGDEASVMDWTIFIVLCIVVFLLIIILIPVLICCIMLATKKGRAAAGLSAASGKPTANKNANNPKKPTKGAKAKTK